jgi:hypothetical protein
MDDREIGMDEMATAPRPPTFVTSIMESCVAGAGRYVVTVAESLKKVGAV